MTIDVNTLIEHLSIILSGGLIEKARFQPDLSCATLSLDCELGIIARAPEADGTLSSEFGIYDIGQLIQALKSFVGDVHLSLVKNQLVLRGQTSEDSNMTLAWVLADDSGIQAGAVTDDDDKNDIMDTSNAESWLTTQMDSAKGSFDISPKVLKDLKLLSNEKGPVKAVKVKIKVTNHIVTLTMIGMPGNNREARLTVGNCGALDCTCVVNSNLLKNAMSGMSIDAEHPLQVWLCPDNVLLRHRDGKYISFLSLVEEVK